MCYIGGVFVTTGDARVTMRVARRVVGGCVGDDVVGVSARCRHIHSPTYYEVPPYIVAQMVTPPKH